MIAIESINGKQYTVVRYNGFTRHGSLRFNLFDGFVWNTAEGVPTSIALPALPRHPTPEHARLLYRYMAEGIKIHMRIDGESDTIIANGYDAATNVLYDNFGTYDGVHISLCEITHATDSGGNRIEIAIEG